jgi:quinol monooxygenase YgiN
MGGSAAGAAIWGQLASWTDLRTAIFAAAGFGLVTLLAARKVSIGGGDTPDDDMSPALPQGMLAEPAGAVDPDAGPVMVTVEYRIDPAHAAAFRAVMRDTRAARLRQGALSWGLFKDVSVPGRYIEYFLDETWIEHLRRHERFTAADVDLRERRLAFHLGGEPPPPPPTQLASAEPLRPACLARLATYMARSVASIRSMSSLRAASAPAWHWMPTLADTPRPGLSASAAC